MHSPSCLPARAGLPGKWKSQVLAAALLTFFCILQVQAQVLNWQTDFARAKAAATESRRFMLLDFTGSDWCPWCIRMDKEVFERPAFADFAAKHLVLVKLDFPRGKPQPPAEKVQNEQLAQKFKIQGYPTYVLLDTAGNEVRRQEGYLPGGPVEFIRWLGLPSPVSAGVR
ncbi:MAG: thioredoxin family protein [Verrucomicrobia bacterium]|nr:thioredoxin family protein [Verrucomicrobiota bacterium]